MDWGELAHRILHFKLIGRLAMNRPPPAVRLSMPHLLLKLSLFLSAVLVGESMTKWEDHPRLLVVMVKSQV